MIGLFLLGEKIDYPPLGYVLTALGLSAITPDFRIPAIINGPLWSLSVEIYLSFFLLVTPFIKKIPQFLILIFLISMSNFCGFNFVVSSLPIFYFGYMLPGIKLKESSFKLISTSCLIFSSIALLGTPRILQGFYGNSSLNSAIEFLVASMIMLLCIMNPSSTNNFLSRLSQRSYSLYAVHYPIFLFIDRILFVNSARTTAFQFLISILVLVIGTEITYRFIERPSISGARHFLQKR